MGENQTRRYQTSGDLTSELVKKTYIAFCGSYRQSKSHKVLMVVLMVEMVLLLILNHINGESGKGLLSFAVFAGAYIVIDILMSWAIRYGTKMTVKRFEEESHTGVRGNTSSFTDTQVYLENHGSGGACYINLTEMKRLMQVDNVWMLATKTGAFIPIFVDKLSETDQKSVLDLLKQNNPKIKIQISKK